MLLDDYLRQFGDNRRVTLVGPVLAQPLSWETLEEPLIWVDGGADHRQPSATQRGIGFAVGDGDSSRSELHQYLPTDKDYSDLEFVLRHLPGRFTEVILLGFLGARRDHELFNLGEVHHFLTAVKAPTRVHFARSITAYSKGEWRFEAHGVFSLAVIAPTTVKLAGACKFPLTTPTQLAPLTSLGLSNHGFGAITLTTHAPAFIFQPEGNPAPPQKQRRTPTPPAQSSA